MIAGGGNIGKHLSESMSSNFQVKVIEVDRQNRIRLSMKAIKE